MKNFALANAISLEELGNAIRQRRKQLNYTLEDIEKFTQISRKTLIKLEKGGDVRFFTLTTVLSILGLRLDLSAHSKELLQNPSETSDEEWY